MQSTQIPQTALTTSRLGFGTASLHHLFSERARHTLLASALDAGFTHFDTARMYGEGQAERTLGRFLSGGLRHRITLASKFGMPAVPALEHMPGLMLAQRALGVLARRAGLASHGGQRLRVLSLAAAEQSLSRSLRALRTDWLDILFAHAPEPGDAVALGELAPWLQGQKQSGKVLYLGLSGEATACLSLARQLPGVFDVLQVEDSLDGREADLLAEADWPLQLSFGYLRHVCRAGTASTGPLSAAAVVQAALARNTAGTVLVASRSAAHLRALAQAAG